MSKKILLIDDSPDDLEILKIYLKQNGMEDIVLAETGEEGIEKVNSEKPDIVVTDTNLPKMHGFEVCKYIKDTFGNEVKVIVQTGVVDAVDAGRARENGADDYCVKTSDCEDLLEAIKNLE